MRLIMENWRHFQEQERLVELFGFGREAPAEEEEDALGQEEEPKIQTVGQLRALFRNMKLKKTGGAAAKKMAKLGLSFLGPVGGAIQAGWDAAEEGGEIVSALKALYGADDKFRSNTGLDALNMDDNISKIIDDPIEVAFLKYFIKKFEGLDDSARLDDVDMEQEMQEFLASKFAGHSVKK